MNPKKRHHIQYPEPPGKMQYSVFNIQVYKIRAEMGSSAICLFIYLLKKEKKKKMHLSEGIHPGGAPIKYNVVYGYTFIYNLNMESEAFLQCAILQEGTNSILESRGCSSWCLQQAQPLHNNALPRLRNVISPARAHLSNFTTFTISQTFISFIIANKVSLRI